MPTRSQIIGKRRARREGGASSLPRQVACCGERAIAAAGDETVCEQVIDDRTLVVTVWCCGDENTRYTETDALSECQGTPPKPLECIGQNWSL